MLRSGKICMSLLYNYITNSLTEKTNETTNEKTNKQFISISVTEDKAFFIDKQPVNFEKHVGSMSCNLTLKKMYAAFDR